MLFILIICAKFIYIYHLYLGYLASHRTVSYELTVETTTDLLKSLFPFILLTVIDLHLP
jgi:hypothetical protein